jgi:1-acyl-sn-glycerol-3-phosphate acyltransferase
MNVAQRTERTARPPHSQGLAGRVGGLLDPMVAALDTLVSAELCKQPFQRDPAFIERLLPLVRAVNAYFGTEYRGWEHVPRDTPCLIVGNHSGGAEAVDFWFLLNQWVADRGAAAPLYGLAYDLLFAAPGMGPALRRVGIIPASPANAHKALRMGAAVSVFPGGDYEVFRPWSERNRIDFGGHTGFIRLAISSGVPVVPMTIHGAHQSTLVLTRGRALAHAAGMDRVHVNIFPFIWNIPFGLTPAFVPSLQLPAKVIVQFGRPLDWSRYRGAPARDGALLRTRYDEITGVMQQTLDGLAREDPHPILTRLRELDLAHTARQLEALLAPAPRPRPASAIRRHAPRRSARAGNVQRRPSRP